MGRLKQEKILFCGYRQWAIGIYEALGIDCDFVSSPEELKQKTIRNMLRNNILYWLELDSRRSAASV